MAKRALGRGLSALLGEGATAPATAPIPPAERGTPGPAMIGDREAALLPVDRIRANPHQPRKIMDEAALAELAASIRENGVIQPVLVRRVSDGYELVAGERRLRASRLAEKAEIPALVCTLEEQESLKLALLENIQREDLNAIEEAEAYRSIMDEYGATHQEVADMLGKNRSTVSNMLRLLSLEASIQELVVGGGLSMGHARALLSLEDPVQRLRLARGVQRDGLSVRALEQKIQSLTGGTKRKKSDEEAPAPKADPDAQAVRAFEERLQHHLGSPVHIRRQAGKGRIEIQFFSDEDLQRVIEQLGVSPQL